MNYLLYNGQKPFLQAKHNNKTVLVILNTSQIKTIRNKAKIQAGPIKIQNQISFNIFTPVVIVNQKIATQYQST